MRPWMDRATLRGRIHGRLLFVLVAVAALASVTAIWQFSALRDDDDPDIAAIDERQALSGGATDAEADSTISASEAPSPTTSASPGEDPSSSATASEPAATTEGAANGPECTASLSLDSEWNGAVSVTVTVANTGPDAFGGWEVDLAIKHLSVTTTWGLEHVDGSRYRDILINGSVEPGGSVTPSFQADVRGNYELPETVPCSPI